MAEPSDCKSVLVVDDDQDMLDLLSETLGQAGYDCTSVPSGLRALSHLASGSPVDIVFSDIGMPGINGIELLRTVKTVAPTTPVVLISGMYELDLGMDALRIGAADYLYKPVKPSTVLEMARRYLGPNVRRNEVVFQEALRRQLQANGDVPLETSQVLAVFESLGLRRRETQQHSRRVADYCLLVGRRHGLSRNELEGLRLGALLHDIGKIAIPYNVIMKPGALTAPEWDVIRLHPELGWELLSPFPPLREASQVVRSHHERWEGGGYPQGLKGEEIPIGARIFSVVDTLDAMVSDRPYRKGCSIDTARAEITGLSGSQFEPAIVESFNTVSDLELVEIRRRYPG